MKAPHGYVRLLPQKKDPGYLAPQISILSRNEAVYEPDSYDEYAASEHDIDDLTVPDAKMAPNQPRNPAGSSTGGQWVSARGSGAAGGGNNGNAGGATTSGGPAGGGRPDMGDIPISAKDVKGFAGGSAEAHIVQNADGSFGFTAERQALHDKIISDALDGVPKSSDPTFTIMGGGPASGKTTLLERGYFGEVPKGKAAAQINSDVVKEQMPEWKSMGNDTKKAGFVHEESSYVAKRLVAASQQRQIDMVLDGTGDSSPQSMINKIDAARAAGYKVQAFYVSQPTEQAVAGAIMRGQKTGRYVNETIIRETHAGVSKTFPEIANRFDSVKLFDTGQLWTNGTVTLLAQGKGGSLTIVDQAGYQTFVDKGK